MIEIYGLYDPDSGALRYVGKAKNANLRLKRHILERHLNRPICRWVKYLVESGKSPIVRVLEVVQDSEWESAERRLIAEHRKTSDLLNLADGGAMPSQSKEQRRKAAKASWSAQMSKDPEWRAFVKSKMETARLLARFMKDGAKTGKYFHAYQLRFMMKLSYARSPMLYPTWANL